MQAQLEKLGIILADEISDYSEFSCMQESVYACFLQAESNQKIDDLDWVSWVFEYREISSIFIKKLFEVSFTGKEFFIWIGSRSPGKNDYVEILGQSYFSKN